MDQDRQYVIPPENPADLLRVAEAVRPLYGQPYDRWSEPVKDSAQAMFDRFAQLWRKETVHMSSATDMLSHPAYKAIIQMGERAIPPILRALEKKPAHWGAALHAITGARPVPKEDAGRVDRIAAAWLCWARQQGYRW